MAAQKAERYREEREALKANLEQLQRAIVVQEQKLKEATCPEEDLEELHREIARLMGELDQSRTQKELEVLRAVEAVRNRQEDKERNWSLREQTWLERECSLREEI